MMLQRTTAERVLRVGHLFCGIGAGAKGFADARPRVGHVAARFECAGGIDVDAGAIRNFERLTGTRGTVMDLFDREQHEAFHGRSPGPDWREATPADIRAVFGRRLHTMFLSAPCKGFSGLLSQKASGTARYQALNRLTLRGVWLTLEAYRDEPIDVILFENVPRIATRGRHLLDQIVALLRSYGYAVVESAHDCGEIGELAQHRNRFLLVARHAARVPPFLYQPVKGRVRGVGEVIGRLPLPGAPEAGPMHAVPRLQWQTWVRLAFVPAGRDWRALNELAVEAGHLRDFGIVPDAGLRDNQLGVLGWRDTAPVITGQRSPAQGRFSVADPRTPVRQDDHLGVHSWDDPCGVIGGRGGPTNGAYSVSDPRPRQDNQSFGQYGVREWIDPAGTVTAQAAPGGGPNSIADPRMPGPPRFNNVYRIVPYDSASPAVAGPGGPASGLAVADPRSDTAFAGAGKYRVTRADEPAGTIIAGSTTGQGAFAIADPNPGYADAHHNVLRVTPFDQPSGTVTSGHGPTTGAISVANPRPAGLNAPARDVYASQGHYGVVDWREPAGAVPGYAKHDRGHWSVADPRDVAPEPVAQLPAARDRLVARIVALDGTWHRPFTTLELAALQSLFDPGEVFDLEGGSDQLKREWIGNAVPSAAARGMAETIGETLLLASLGETFTLSSRAIWAKPLAIALAVDPAQATDGMEAA